MTSFIFAPEEVLKAEVFIHQNVVVESGLCIKIVGSVNFACIECETTLAEFMEYVPPMNKPSAVQRLIDSRLAPHEGVHQLSKHFELI